MRGSIVINSLPQAYEVIKQMNLDTDQGESDYRKAGRQSLETILEGRMQERISWYLEEMARLGEYDRRNGYFSRHLVKELGDIELAVPRTPRFSPVRIVRAYARRAPHIDRMILACFVLGISARKVATALLPVRTRERHNGLSRGQEPRYGSSGISSKTHQETVPISDL